MSPDPLSRPRQPWLGPVLLFAAFNLLIVPFLGRGAWYFMLRLNEADAKPGAVLLSLLTALAIAGANALLTARATAAGLPRRGQMALWLATGATFALTIGTGFFSPVNLLIALLRSV